MSGSSSVVVLRPALRAPIVCAAALVFSMLTLVTSAQAQLPVARLNTVFPPGGKVGASFDVTITGADLEQANKLVFTHAGITAAVKTREPGPFEVGPQPVPNTFVVKVDPSVPAGWYEARAVGKFGISNSRAFQVDDLTESAEKEPNNTRDTATPVEVGAVVSGQMNAAADVDLLKFAAKQGQRLTIDCWASRIDSRMEPILTVLDASGRELAGATNNNYRDATIDFLVPADGDFYVRVYDAVYGGSPEYFYRLSISAKPYIEYVLPSAGLPGTKGAFTLYGRNLPGGADAGVALNGKPLQKLSVQIDVPAGPESQRLVAGTLLEPSSSSIDGFEYRLRGPTGASNGVMIGFASTPIVMEQEPNTPQQPQRITVPCEFVGQMQTRLDRDCVIFDAKAGEVYWMEMISQRQGSPLDAQFFVERVVVDKDGKQTFTAISPPQGLDDNPSVATVGGIAFNTRCDDRAFRFAAPADGTYRVTIRDLYQRGNPRFVYRLAIRREQPDFRLAVTSPFPVNPQQQLVSPWATLLRRGGSENLHVYAFRRDGFNENIEVSIEGLPAGVTCPPITLGPGQNSAHLMLSAAETAAEFAGAIRIVGKATVGGQPLVREARGGAVIWPGVQNQSPPSRVSREIALAVTANETAVFQISANDGKVLETYRAGKIDVPLKAIRRDKFAGNLQLTSLGTVHNIQIPATALAAAATDGKIAINVPVAVPAGTYTFSLAAQTQVPYARNADLAKAAETEKARVEKVVNDLTAEVKRLTDELTKINASKATNEAKAAAQKAVTDATTKLNAAKAFQQTVNQQATNLANASKPQNLNVFQPVTTFTIKVAESPLAFAAAQPAAAIKQGAKLEIPVTLNRLFGYVEPITLELVPPANAANISAAPVTIPAGQAQGKLVIQAAANATAGAHTFIVRATARPGGQALPITQNLALTVEAVQPAKK